MKEQSPPPPPCPPFSLYIIKVFVLYLILSWPFLTATPPLHLIQNL